MDADALKQALGELLKDPEMKASIQSMLDDTTKDKKEPGVFDVSDIKLTPEEKKISEATKANRAPRHTRQRVNMVNKVCPKCGMTIRVVQGGPLDLPNFICDKCRVG